MHAKIYRCPNCNGTEITWDGGIGKAVCPIDRTPVNNYKIVPDLEKQLLSLSHGCLINTDDFPS